MNMQQGVHAGVGITIDPDNEAVILVIVGTEETKIASPMTPDVAIAFSRALRRMAREAQTLQDEIEELSPEEAQDRLIAIQNRFAAETN